jgi:outer membrane protein
MLNCSFYTGGIAQLGITAPAMERRFDNAFNNSAPDKGIGFNLQYSLRNRTRRRQARSLDGVSPGGVAAGAALHADSHAGGECAVRADQRPGAGAGCIAARDYNQQSLDAEVKKLRLGASTTANVLLQERNLATAENNLIAAQAAYAKDRAGLYQMLASTLQHYGINLNEPATGEVKTRP